MQLANLLTIALLGASTATAGVSEPRVTKKPCFPNDIQAGVLNIQNYINVVINEIVQNNTDSIALDYSSTGRSLAFLERAILPKGCPATPFVPIDQNSDANIANLQKTQLRLSYLAQDAINSQCKKGKKDVCAAVYLYGQVAQYVDLIRTDGQ